MTAGRLRCDSHETPSDIYTHHQITLRVRLAGKARIGRIVQTTSQEVLTDAPFNQEARPADRHRRAGHGGHGHRDRDRSVGELGVWLEGPEQHDDDAIIHASPTRRRAGTGTARSRTSAGAEIGIAAERRHAWPVSEHAQWLNRQ